MATEFKIPFAHNSKVYYVHSEKWWKRNSPYIVTKGTVTGVWATNTVGVILDFNNYVGEDEFDCIFTNKDDAVEYCLKKNSYRKVKIYGE